LLRHAARVGAKVFEETKVTEVELEGEGADAKPKAALWKNKQGETGKITFDSVIDASGGAGILSVKYLRNRHFNDDSKNATVWRYWEAAGKYLPGST
jgi:flavin-dependent dehydrogenase